MQSEHQTSTTIEEPTNNVVVGDAAPEAVVATAPVEPEAPEAAPVPAKKSKRVTFAVLGAIFLALFIVIEFVLGGIRFDIAGEQEITLTNLEPYEEQGATARFETVFSAEPVATDLEVSIGGDVDWHKPGTYSVYYRAHWGIWFGQATRTVRVVDTAAPVITLVGNPRHVTQPGETYEEEGFTAIDDYDGDVTSRVERVELDGQVRYTVSDKAGNVAEVTRTIKYYEPVPPELTLKGNEHMTVAQGGEYIEPGYVAFDEADGDLNEYVEVEGSVDTGTLGDYVITYTVADFSGNEARAERLVTVVPAGEKVIYLTFDDGPGPYTSELLDILAEQGVKATFFVTGRGDDTLLAREAAEGHAVGIHSLTHDYNEIYAREEAYFADLNAMQAIIVAQTGREADIVRFPGGSSNMVSSFNPGIMTTLASEVQRAGYQYFDWNVSSGDAGGTTNTDEVYENVISGIEGRSVAVVLQHDVKDFSVAAVERIIKWGKENGYVFATLNSGSPVCHHSINN